MQLNPWEKVLDTLYDMGGRAVFPTQKTESSLEDYENLIVQTDLSLQGIQNASNTLKKMDLVEISEEGHPESAPPARYEVRLTGKGYDFAHSRQQEKRNIRSNNTVAILTLVLVFVGIAQATALTASVSDYVSGDVAAVVTAGSGAILLTIYYALYKAGMVDIGNLLD